MDIYLAGHGILGPYVLPRRGGRDTEIYLAGGESRIRKIWKSTLQEGGGELRGMEVFMVPGNGISKNTIAPHICSEVGRVNILMSYAYIEDAIVRSIPHMRNFLLDSGAFTYLAGRKGAGVDWNRYIEGYADFIKKHDIQRFFELDIDGVVGYDNVLRLRERLEGLVGRKCIPVWHKSRGKDAFVQMCRDYDYVAIGGIVTREIRREEYGYFPYFINTAHKYGAKIHGLGFTYLEGLRKYHFDSVDSTSWTIGNRAGKIFLFNGRTIKIYDKREGTRFKDHVQLARHNFFEWVKFCDYARENL